MKAIQKAWDSLDSGLKQWIVMGVSMALSSIPVVGPLISCIMDGTFVDMIKALSTGDWAMLGMCCLNFVPGGKGASGGLKALFAIGGAGGVAGILGVKAAKSLAKNAEKKALKELVLEKGGKSMLKHDAFKSSQHFLGTRHLSDIAGATHAGNLKKTMANIQEHWASAKFKGLSTGGSGREYHIFESTDLRYVIDDSAGEIVSIFPFL